MKHTLFSKRLLKPITSFIVLILVILACSLPDVVFDDGGTQQPIPLGAGDNSVISGDAAGASPDSQGDDDEPGFSFTLSDGQAQPDVAVSLPVAVGEPLSEDDIQRIIARLPE